MPLTPDEEKALVSFAHKVSSPGVQMDFAAINWAPIIQALLAGLTGINWSAIIAALLPAILPPAPGGTTPAPAAGGTPPTITAH
jgi:hypothetical protein